jgi:rhamnosyltransferase
LSKKSDFILFFDQDSDVSEDLVERLIAEYMVLLERKCRIGCLGPMIFERSLNVKISPKRKLDIVNNSCRVEAIITSSMLTTYRNLEAIGFWNEDIFLDFADWDLCWRFQKNNLLCYITDNVLLNHKLGYSVKKIGNYQIIEDNPIREYYQIRDGIKLLFKSYTPFRYRIHFLILIVFRPYLHMLFLKNRYLRIKYIITGIIDFFRCKSNALV